MSAFLTLNASEDGTDALTISQLGSALDAANSDLQWDVVAGGAIGDNTVTVVIRSTDVASAAGTNDATKIQLLNATIGGFKIKNLTPALATAGGQVKLGVEFASPGDVPGIVDTPTDVISDTATPATIFDSALAVRYTVTPAALPRINVGDNEKRFTATIPGDNDFSTGVRDANLGTVKLSLVAGVMKEAGVPFDFQGGDAHTLALTATGTAPLKAFDVTPNPDNVYMEIGGCTNTPDPLLGGSRGTVNTAQNGVTFNLTGSTAVLTTTYNMCLRSDLVDQIAETTIDSTWSVDYFNTRYVNDALDGAAFNPLLRNGCKVSLFNVPGVDNGTDDGFIRLTNTDDTVGGAVRATVYAQDGTQVVDNKDVVPSVLPHATVVLTPELGITNTTQLTDLTGTGRYRVVLTGAFPSCEALGLVRNQSTGMLVNMTATTNANSDSHTALGTTIKPGNTGR
jgi:hypothetical protein